MAAKVRSADPGDRVAAGVLARVRLFGKAPASGLARASHTMHAPRGTAIARRGERLHELAVVARGLVKLSLKGDTEKVLRLAGPGETFGEEGLFLDRPLAVDITALADTLLVMVPEKALRRLLETDARFARELVASLCERLEALVAGLEATTHGARERLASYVISIAREGTATLPASKTVVASQLGITKETLSRLLHRLAADGLIAVNRREILVLDQARLSAASRRRRAAVRR